MPLLGTVTQITSGIVAPDPANGMDGDVYLLVDAGGIVLKTYQRLAGIWVQIGNVNVATSGSGYVVLTNKVIFQWGTATTGAGGTVTITFPISFTILKQVMAVPLNTVSTDIVCVSLNGTPTVSSWPARFVRFIWHGAANIERVTDPGETIYWFAIGE